MMHLRAASKARLRKLEQMSCVDSINDISKQDVEEKAWTSPTRDNKVLTISVSRAQAPTSLDFLSQFSLFTHGSPR